MPIISSFRGGFCFFFLGGGGDCHLSFWLFFPLFYRNFWNNLRPIDVARLFVVL